MNGTIVYVVFRDLGLYFQVQAFSCYAFAIKQMAQAAEVPVRFASTRTGLAVKLVLCNTAVRTDGQKDGRTDGQTDERTGG